MKTILLLFTLMIIFSCEKKEKLPERDKFGRRIFYNQLDYFNYTSSPKKTKPEPVIIIDTLCINETARAIKDIQNNQLTYHTGWTPQEKELSVALKKYDIKLKPFSLTPSCIVSKFRSHCYEGEMNEELINRYGIHFFDSIWNSTLEEHVKKNPNEMIHEDGMMFKLKDNYKFLLKKAHNSSLAQ